ncbi:hypothetical protein LJR230_000700 [Trinickia sp. LjRoot230]|uniref:hypothetical protein n=1 Tax=Trinickia sp. LjRoot230 TaxID=3342288 RepID=UPI003ECC56D9
MRDRQAEKKRRHANQRGAPMNGKRLATYFLQKRRDAAGHGKSVFDAIEYSKLIDFIYSIAEQIS